MPLAMEPWDIVHVMVLTQWRQWWVGASMVPCDVFLRLMTVLIKLQSTEYKFCLVLISSCRFFFNQDFSERHVFPDD